VSSIDPRIGERLRGPAWDAVRSTFDSLCNSVLGVADSTRAELTTIYVKFSISGDASAPVYAVAWLKTSKNVVIGFALPEDFDAPLLTSAPAGMKYKGLTKYFRIVPDAVLPVEIQHWARLAYSEVTSEKSDE
jgi:hypothetical protein